MSKNSVALKTEEKIQNEPIKKNKHTETHFHHAFALKAEYWNALNNLSW